MHGCALAQLPCEQDFGAGVRCEEHRHSLLRPAHPPGGEQHSGVQLLVFPSTPTSWFEDNKIGNFHVVSMRASWAALWPLSSWKCFTVQTLILMHFCVTCLIASTHNKSPPCLTTQVNCELQMTYPTRVINPCLCPSSPAKQILRRKRIFTNGKGT